MPTYIFKTSINCNSCLSKVKPVLDARAEIRSWQIDLENPDKILTVVYNPNKTDDKKIRLLLNSLGYDADDTKANQAAYDKLPPCCKKPDASKKN